MRAFGKVFCNARTTKAGAAKAPLVGRAIGRPLSELRPERVPDRVRPVVVIERGDLGFEGGSERVERVGSGHGVADRRGAAALQFGCLIDDQHSMLKR